MDEGAVVRLAMTSGGVVTLSRLLAAGLTRRDVDRAVRNGTLHRTRRNAYVPELIRRAAAGRLVREHTLRAAAAIASLRIGGAVASHTTAAMMHDLDLLGPMPRDVTLTRSAGHRVCQGGIDIAVAALPDRHVTRVFGLPVTTAARTVIDLARSGDFAAGLVVADCALHRIATEEIDLYEVLTDCRGWPGIETARRVVRHADAKAESALESLSRARFIEAGFPLPDTQAMILELPTPRRVDFLWRTERVVGEADGMGKYADPAVIADEKLRDELLRQAGYEVVHFVWREISQTPETVLARVRGAFGRARKLGYW